MESKKQISRDKPLTIREWRSLYRNMAVLMAMQEKKINQMIETIRFLEGRQLEKEIKSIEEEYKKVRAQKNNLQDRISSMQTKEINRLRELKGLPPLGDPDPSEIYLSISNSGE